jgi:transcriptional regulator with XRE-family HTH domain
VSGLPVVSGAQLIRALERLGWETVRQRGSHVRLRHRFRDPRSRKLDGILTAGYSTRMTVLALEAQRVRDAAHLSDRQIAAATGARPSTVRDWLNGRSGPTGSRADRLIELAEMTDRLARVMEPSYIPVWLNRPLEALDDDKPVELLARGDYRRVAQLIAELEYPGVS